MKQSVKMIVIYFGQVNDNYIVSLKFIKYDTFFLKWELTGDADRLMQWVYFVCILNQLSYPLRGVINYCKYYLN